MVDTDTLKVGDTVYGIKYTWIKNFDDDYYAIPIPTSVYKTTIEYYSEEIATWCRNEVRVTINLANGIKVWNKEIKRCGLYKDKDKALEVLKKERKRFVKDFPNNWKEIIKVLNELLEEYSND